MVRCSLAYLLEDTGSLDVPTGAVTRLAQRQSLGDSTRHAADRPSAASFLRLAPPPRDGERCCMTLNPVTFDRPGIAMSGIGDAAAATTNRYRQKPPCSVDPRTYCAGPVRGTKSGSRRQSLASAAGSLSRSWP